MTMMQYIMDRAEKNMKFMRRNMKILLSKEKRTQIFQYTALT